jgi:DnaK suppressor protein
LLSHVIIGWRNRNYREDCSLAMRRRRKMPTVKQLGELRSMLAERHQALREQIHQELLSSDEEHYIDLAGQVHDLEEESVADLLIDLGLAVIDMHINEIRDVEAALRRIDIGAFGVCIDCDDDIEVARLRAFPTAKRCLPCQENYERNHAGNETPTL